MVWEVRVWWVSMLGVSYKRKNPCRYHTGVLVNGLLFHQSWGLVNTKLFTWLNCSLLGPKIALTYFRAALPTL